MSLIVSDTLREYPGCKVILAHAGGTLPYLVYRAAGMLPETPMTVGKSTAEMIEEASEFYYDTAISANPATLKALCEIAKPGHVLFGTDYPNAPTAAIKYFTNNLERFDMGVESLSENAKFLFPRLKAFG